MQYAIRLWTILLSWAVLSAAGGEISPLGPWDDCTSAYELFPGSFTAVELTSECSTVFRIRDVPAGDLDVQILEAEFGSPIPWIRWHTAGDETGVLSADVARGEIDFERRRLSLEVDSPGDVAFVVDLESVSGVYKYMVAVSSAAFVVSARGESVALGPGVVGDVACPRSPLKTIDDPVDESEIEAISAPTARTGEDIGKEGDVGPFGGARRTLDRDLLRDHSGFARPLPLGSLICYSDAEMLGMTRSLPVSIDLHVGGVLIIDFSGSSELEGRLYSSDGTLLAMESTKRNVEGRVIESLPRGTYLFGVSWDTVPGQVCARSMQWLGGET